LGKAEPGFPGKAVRKLQPQIGPRLGEKSVQGRKATQPFSSLKQVKQMLDGKKAANHQLTQFMVQDYRPYSFKELQTFWQNIPFNNLRQAAAAAASVEGFGAIKALLEEACSTESGFKAHMPRSGEAIIATVQAETATDQVRADVPTSAKEDLPSRHTPF
jgi:hypothetical protein